MKKSVFMIILLCLIFCLSACDSEAPEEKAPVAVAIVVGNHANAYAPNFSDPALISDVARAALDGFLSVVCCDGQPYVVSADLYSIPEQYRQADPQKLKSDAQAKANKLLAGLGSVKARAAELDTLSALWWAAKSLSSAPAGSEKIIHILDTGLSTSGTLNFQNNLLTAEPDTIAEMLAESGALPDFFGITIKWSQMGDVAPPQEPLSHAQVQKLADIWTAIIEKGGGTMEMSGTPPTQQAADPAQYPKISVVTLPTETAISFDPDKITVFDEKQVRFIGDTAKYVDPDTAKVALRPAAEYMMAHPEFKALLVGTTATGGKEFCLQLSQDRAEAVRDTLVSMGVLDKQLITLGFGFDDPWHIADHDAKGRQIERLASQNRKVVLMAADSEEAKKIIG